MTLALYRGLTDAAAPLIRHYVDQRMRRGKEDAGRVAERYGIASVARPQGKLVWIHAASVGESLSALPVIARLGAELPGATVLVTTGTVSSARLLADRLPPFAIHQFVPIDRAAWVRRFLDHWRADIAIWIESELWPNLILESCARDIPLILLNARMSDRSYNKWRRVPATASKLLSAFETCLAQTEDDAQKLRRLGGRNVVSAGNIKFAAPALSVDDIELAALRRRLADRRVWVAASTHPGEEEVVADADAAIRGSIDGLLTIIVPRHPPRSTEIVRLLRARGRRIAVRSAGDVIAPETEIYLADTIGELGLFFRLAEIAFIGGSLVPHGGQNPLEGARLGCALVHGPHMQNFAEIRFELAESGAAATISDASSLAAEIAALMRDSTRRDERAASAQRVAVAKAEILDAVFAELAVALDRIRPSGNGQMTARA